VGCRERVFWSDSEVEVSDEDGEVGGGEMGEGED
jgi:hypothetical protein